MPNFTECAAFFRDASQDVLDKYAYTGPVYGILRDASVPAILITHQGCREVCGTGNDYYPWSVASSTISTWVLPVIGLLLQAPYESNAFVATMYAMARWVGSPIASLSYILWAVKISGKCTLMVDMSTRYEEVPDEDSQFEQIRDSFYLLGMMNQYTIKRRMPAQEAERLLRIALFSDSLQLMVVEDETRSLVKRRRKLARTIREHRKRGVVPVFISLMWFLFSLVVSIQGAFGQLGSNATAHNLALGLLLAWLPVLILCSIVDRNPTAVDATRIKLNRLIDAVRVALLNPELRDTYIRQIRRQSSDFTWTKVLSNDDYFREDFFIRFAGQGRVRWHYGVAHPILAGIEESFVAKYGRDWLRDAEWARTKLVKGPKVLSGLSYFDFREIWQIMSSIVIVVGCVSGAFIISYYTPTVGLGCRSGGYLVFTIIAFGIFALEMLFWWLVPEGSISDDDVFTRMASNLERKLSRSPSNTWNILVKTRARNALSWWQRKTIRDRIESLVLQPMEVCNCIWLMYIVTAQTFGSYRNCDCMSSIWGTIGGYLDFEDIETYRNAGVSYYWGLGTGLSGLIMVISFAFIITEWCTQSHLSTENYDSARRGLRRTRRFKKYTSYFRDIPNFMISITKGAWLRVRGRKTFGETNRRSLVWTSKTKERNAPSTSIATIVDGVEPSIRTNSMNTPGEEESALLVKGKDGHEWGFDMQSLRSPDELHRPGSHQSPRPSFGESGQRPPSWRSPLTPNDMP